jgi:hypothetical protein
MSNITASNAIALRIASQAATTTSLEELSYAGVALKKLKDQYGITPAIVSAENAVLDRMETLSATATSISQLSYAGAAITQLDDPYSNDEVYTIGTPGNLGFGVSALYESEIPSGWTALPGHDDPKSPNYGNYLDTNNSHMVFFRKFWVKRNADNTFDISKVMKSGYALHEAFRHCSIGVMRDKSHVVNVGGIPVSKLGVRPLSTSSANNPISQLNGTPPNTYAGMVTAIKLRGADFYEETMFFSDMLAMISKAHSQASSNTAVCAWRDVSPFMPKGNNNNALRDANDSGVVFATSGHSSCALTGSGVPFAKTTHNGQACGVADVNGNMWRVNPGLTKLNETDAIFKILKTSVKPQDITAANLHDTALYDDLDLSALMPTGAQGWIYFGNGSSQVFSSSSDVNSLDFRAACAGIPLSTGVSAGGTSAFGDGFYRWWRTNLLPLSGGYWGRSFNAGVFARFLYFASSTSTTDVGGAACVSL